MLTLVALFAVCPLWVQEQQLQDALNRQLIDALLCDDTQTALELVNEGADPNTCQKPSPAPTFKSLLSRLLHPSSPPVNDNPTAFLIACGEETGNGGFLPTSFPECVPLVKAMLAYGANANVSTHRQYTPLHFAALSGRLPTVTLLLAHGANPNAQDVHGQTPLVLVASHGEIETMRLLLAHGAKPILADSDGRPPLFYAVQSPHPANIVTELLAHGANPNVADKLGDTPLRLAQRLHHVDLVHLLQRGK